MDKINKVLEDKMDDYNTGNKKMKLVFFKDAIEHILRIARVFRQPRGNLMLIGVGGSGKQSLAKLTSFIYEFNVESIEMKKNYNQDDFREFLKILLEKCGRDGKSVSFIFTDAHVVYESFLEDINNLINSGEVPNLWDSEKERLDQVIKDIRGVNQQMGRIDQIDVIYQTFVERVRNYLHVILCMSPVGDNLRIRCRQFPSLVDCSTLDWFASWPEEALYSVSEKLLQELELPSEVVREKLAGMCKAVHLESQEVALKFEVELKRKVYFTPKSYLDLINLYMDILEKKRLELCSYQRRLTNGLSTLDQANKQVAILKEQLIELQPQLEEQSQKVEIALEKVNQDQSIAQEKEQVVEAEAYEIRKQAEDMKRIADEAQFDLNKVMPAMEEAERSVKEIDRAPLIEMRTYSKPPPIMDLVLEGVFILFGKKYDWNAAKLMMQDLNDFINKLINFDKDHISEETLFKLKKHLTNPNFNPEVIGKKVKAGKDLCQWCIAMEQYSKVYKNVVPKQKKAQELKEILDQKTAVLAKKQDELDIVKANVKRLQEEMEVMVAKKTELEKTITLTQDRLLRSEKLITLLAEEGKRWVINVQQIKDEQENLVGDVFFSCACISYCGPFTSVFRNQLQQQWSKEIQEIDLLVSQNLSLVKTLGDPLTLREWTLSGLPSDAVSQDNSLFAMMGFRWPLLIDPQEQASKWIKKAFIENKIKILKFQDAQFINEMKGAIQFGFFILIPDVPTRLEPILDPILTKETFPSSEGEMLIKFADSDIQYDNNFQLFMTTKDPNPAYLPDVFIKTNVINFTVTFEGLEDQLLADVVKHEEPEKEKIRDENIVNLAKYRRQIKESEKQILQLLENSKKNNSNIVDDVKLIETLEKSKVISEDITVRIQESTEIEAKISVVRNQYREASIRGALLYFVVRDLALIDPMYQYSLQYIQRTFNKAIDSTPKSDTLQQRLTDLQNSITKSIYTNVVRGLFEAHKLIFSFLIAVSISKQKGTLAEKEWNVFLRGAGIFDKSEISENPDDAFINENAWNLAYYLDINIEQFFGLCDSVTKNLSVWENYFYCEDPLEEPLPMQWNTILSYFEKLLILKIFRFLFIIKEILILRPEKIMFGLSYYVQQIIGKFYLESPSVSVGSLFTDADSKTPIIFVLSQGADPTNVSSNSYNYIFKAILNYAHDQHNENNFGIISLGQGQGKAAQELIDDCKIKGKWALLQNCHLAKTFMGPLEIILEEIIESSEIHQDFRLILTSMPAEYFPISVLQNGIKLTTEPPRGIKANLKRCFNEISETYLSGCNKEPAHFHKLVWGLAFFHSIIQERKKFGPLGWNKIYEFNDSDLDTSKTVLQMLMNEQDNIPWDALNYVIGQINYGGRVTDDLDRHCLLSILFKFYNPAILEDKFQFCDSDVYYIPDTDTLEGYKQYIDGLPLVDDPEVFGMHENANINFQMQESEKMVSAILSIQPRIGTKTDSEQTEDEIVLELVVTISAEVPKYLNKSNGVKELFEKQESGLIPSLSTVLLQEIDRYNILLTRIKSTLANLKRAISGLIIMSSELDQMYYSLLNNKVPELWDAVGYASLKPLASWIRDLGARVKFLNKWLAEGNPIEYWISGFFFPQGFLTGVLQTHARKHGIAIDELAFSFKFYDPQKDQIVSQFDGVNVNGLFLEGASFDRKKKYLVDQQPGEMFYTMPTIYFNPIEKHETNPGDYLCPVYKTSVRAGVLSTTGQSTNFILTVEVPAGDFPPDFWTLRGTALLTQLNE